MSFMSEEGLKLGEFIPMKIKIFQLLLIFQFILYL